MIVNHKDPAVCILGYIRIRDILSSGNQHAAFPYFSVIIGKPCSQIGSRSHSRCKRFSGKIIGDPMIDQKQFSGFQPADCKTGIGTSENCRFSWTPCFSSIAGKTLADSILTADKHPECSIIPFYNMMLIKGSFRNVCRAEIFKGISVVAADCYIGKRKFFIFFRKIFRFASPNCCG